MSLGLRFGVLLAALALSGGRVLGAGTGQQQSALDLALPATTGSPAFISSAPPPTGTTAQGQALTRLFGAGFRDPQRRAEACEQLPRLGPSEPAALLYRQYRLQMLTGFIIPYRPAFESDAAKGTAGPGGDAFDLYLLCLQDYPR